MNIETLADLYVAELQEVRSVKAQLADAWPKMIEAANAGDLKKVLRDHLGETRSQVDALEAMLLRHGAEVQEHRDQSMQTIIAEAEKWVGMIDEPGCRDAALIASAQRIAHYEIAVFGTLASWADQIGNTGDAGRLVAMLEDEKEADATLTRLAKGAVNPEAI